MKSVESLAQSNELSEEKVLSALEECKSIGTFIIRLHVKSPEDTEDVWQHVCINVLQKFHTLRDKNALVAWIKRIAHNLAVNFALRTQSRFLNEEMPLEFATRDEREPLDQVIANEEIQLVQEVIRTMNEIYRSVVELFYFQGNSLEEISEKLHIPIGTVKRRLHTFREQLQVQIQEHLNR